MGVWLRGGSGPWSALLEQLQRSSSLLPCDSWRQGGDDGLGPGKPGGRRPPLGLGKQSDGGGGGGLVSFARREALWGPDRLISSFVGQLFILEINTLVVANLSEMSELITQLVKCEKHQLV